MAESTKAWMEPLTSVKVKKRSFPKERRSMTRPATATSASVTVPGARSPQAACTSAARWVRS